MILNPMFFTYENLSRLKFKELQKLSKQLCVSRRWNKKKDIINNLLALKDKEVSNNYKNLNINEDEEKEWRDGYLVFNDFEKNTSENEIDKRLTFNITQKSEVNPSNTFEVPQNGENFFGTNDKNVDSRQTYILPSKADFDVQPLMDLESAFDEAQRGKLSTEKHDRRATFTISQNKNKILEKNECDFWESTFTGNIDNEKESVEAKDSAKTSSIKAFKKISFGLSQKEKPKSDSFHVEKLTIPYVGITRRTGKNGETVKNQNSPVKMFKKSNNIKKSNRPITNKLDLIKSSAVSPLNKSVCKETLLQPLTKCKAEKIMQSKIPVKLQLSEQKQKEKKSSTNKNNKENIKKDLRRKSKNSDKNLVKNPSSVTASFLSPPVALTKNLKVYAPVEKTPLKGDIKIKCSSGKLTSQTPKKSVLIRKPETATKMPDFSKIHQKQFEQMDSLHEYIRKKEERTKRLFGTAQPGPQLKRAVESMPLFRFQSTVCEKSRLQLNEAKIKVPQNGTATLNKENTAKCARKETLKKKLPPTKSQTEIREKARNQILGVRTNKRFELQMKFRNM